MTQASAPEVVADTPCAIGENPLWHPDEQVLYWTDIPNGRLYKFDPASGRHEVCYEGPPIGGFTLQDDGSLLLFMAKGAIGQWQARGVTYPHGSMEGEEDGRFNDVIADPMGRVFCGTMPVGPRSGKLYLLDTRGLATVVEPNAGLSNGMGFTPDYRHLYHTDSRARAIRRYDYDIETAVLTNPTPFVSLGDEAGVPDGLTVDAEGYVWSARWGGGCLVRYSSGGAEVFRVHLPVAKVSSLTFGGDGYRDLYVTTAGGDSRESEGGHAGALFRIRMDTAGVPEFRSHVAVR